MSPPAEPPVILVVDDDEGLLMLMAEALREEHYTVLTASSGAKAFAQLAGRRPDLMLLDLKLKDVGGQAMLKQLRRDELLVPFVVVTGQGDEKVAVEVMKEGALDYVMKDTALLDLLPSVVKRALTAVQRERALAATEAERQRLAREILQISEREQHRIGEDLHDGLGQQLTAIEMMCTSLKADAKDQPELERDLEMVGKLLREAIRHVRLLARGLVPVKGEPDALQTSLMELAERARSVGRFQCRFDCPAAVLVHDHAAAGHLFRIAQEAVNNAMKHSRAQAITIGLSRSRGAVELTIADDGRGLPKAKSNGMGLHVMKHRAGVIGAELAIEARPGKGVTITCRWRDSS
ncbi:MAG: response regulator [Verrucomicrobia bacterium]|nr:response regulator [Verrucomicrobiota bacterium]